MMRYRAGISVLAALASALLLAAGPARAQQIPVGTGGSVSSLVGMPVDIPLVVDLSGRTERLGSVTMELRWNPAVLRFDGGSSGTFGALIVNEDSASQGLLRFAGANPAGVPGRVVVGVGRFTPLAADTTSLRIQVTELSAAGSFANLLPSVVLQPSSYCPARGRFGDPTGNGAINSQDALAVLSHAVGLPVPGVDISLGDVDGSGTISTRDALIILSYSVGFDVSAFRVNEIASGACAAPLPQGFAIAPGAVGALEPGQTLALQARVTGAGGSVIPATGVVWSSSDTQVVRVSDLGFVLSVGPGVATVTAIRDNLDTANLTVTVVARRTRHAVDALSPGGVGTPELPFATLAEALERLDPGDTIDLRPGRYEGVAFSVPVTVLGTTLGGQGPVIVPGDQLGVVVVLGAGRYEFRRVAFGGLADRIVDLGGADTVELDSVRIALEPGSCASAAIQGGSIYRLRLRRVFMTGDGYSSGCADGVRLDGNVRQLLLEEVGVSDFGGHGVYVYNADSVSVRRSFVHNNGGYGIWTRAESGGGCCLGEGIRRGVPARADSVPAATNTAFVMDSTRMTGEFSYGLLYIEGVRSATIQRSRFVGGGYGQAIYVQGYYDGNSYRGHLLLRNDSITAPDSYWVSAYGLDSATLDSVRAMGVGDSWFYNVWQVRAERSTFAMTDYYGSALYVSTGGVSQRTRVIVDSVEVRGAGCRCANGINTYNASLEVRRFRAANLEDAIDHYDSALTVTDAVLENVYGGIYGQAHPFSVPPPALVRNVAMSNVAYGVELGGYAGVVDSSSFNGGYVAVELWDQGVDTVRSVAITDHDEGVNAFDAAAVVENNQIMRPRYTGVYLYRYYDLTPAETAVVRFNTITCGLNQGADAVRAMYSSGRVEQNAIANGCSAGIRFEGDASVRPLTIRGNTIQVSASGGYAAIHVYGNYRSQIVSNLIQVDPASDLPGIALYDYAGSTAYARVDSNTISNPRYWGIYAGGVDTLSVRGNLIEDFQARCCPYTPGAISVRSGTGAYLISIAGNTLRRIAGVGINAEQVNSTVATLQIDTNAISQADTAAMRLYTRVAAWVRGNNIRNNLRLGIDFTYDGNAVHEVHGNAFRNNGLWAIRAPFDSVRATGNWWGVDGALPGTSGADSVSGLVDGSAPLASEPAVPPLAPPALTATSPARPGAAMQDPPRFSLARPQAPVRTRPPERTLRRSGGATEVLTQPPVMTQRAVIEERAAAARAAADSLRESRREARRVETQRRVR